MLSGLRFGGCRGVVGKSAERDLRIRGQQTTRKYLVTFDSIPSGISARQAYRHICESIQYCKVQDTLEVLERLKPARLISYLAGMKLQNPNDDAS